jgi:hypothetical protein
VLQLMVHRIPGEGTGPAGWLLRLTGRSVEVQTRSKEGYSVPYRMELTPQALNELAQLLIDNEVGGLPINLYAADYTDFDLQLLNHNKNLQARKFARVTPQTHGERQKQFDRIFAALDRLHEQALKEGRQQTPDK